MKRQQPRSDALAVEKTTVGAGSTERAAKSPRTGDAPVRVLCVDDHAVLVEGLKAAFAADDHIRIVGQLPSASALVEEAGRLRPDVVILDIEMPGLDAFEAADRLRYRQPDVRVVFLSAHIRDGYIAAAYKCGAWGYCAKSDDPEDIATAVIEVARAHRGTFVLGPKVRRQLPRLTAPRAPASPGGESEARRSGAAEPHTPLESLTPREIEVLRLIGKGRTRNEIAAELSRSVKTIDGHQERIMRKLAIAARADLMRFAIREGLVEA